MLVMGMYYGIACVCHTFPFGRERPYVSVRFTWTVQNNRILAMLCKIAFYLCVVAICLSVLTEKFFFLLYLWCTIMLV